MPRFRFLAAALLLAVCAPSLVRAQGTAIGSHEDALGSNDWTARARAVTELALRAPEISAGGLTKLITLLDSELAGTASQAGPEEDDEAYGQYIMQLTALITRFNDPRATPLLAKQGIAITRGAVFQVAMAGDAGIGPLVGAWNENPALRPAVVRTMGEMRYYADSTGTGISATTRGTIDDYLLRAAVAAEPWLRHAFVDAAGATRDARYLSLVADLAANDGATIDGRRYVAGDAARLVPALQSSRAAATPRSIVDGLLANQRSACTLGWITGAGICNSLRAKLAAARTSIVAGDNATARGQLGDLLDELSAQRGKSVSERAYSLLAENTTYLVSRL